MNQSSGFNKFAADTRPTDTATSDGAVKPDMVKPGTVKPGAVSQEHGPQKVRIVTAQETAKPDAPAAAPNKPQADKMPGDKPAPDKAQPAVAPASKP